MMQSMNIPAGSLGGGLALWVLASGCASLVDCRPLPDTEPDLELIVTVVSDVYRGAGQGRIIFLGADDETIEEGMLSAAGNLLEQELRVKVRPESEADRGSLTLPVMTPVLLETGEIGISISLGRFSLDEQGWIHVDVSYARSGLDGAIFAYTLQPTEEGWAIVDVQLTAVA